MRAMFREIAQTTRRPLSCFAAPNAAFWASVTPSENITRRLAGPIQPLSRVLRINEHSCRKPSEFSPSMPPVALIRIGAGWPALI